MLTPDRLRRFEAKCIPEPMSGCKLWFGGCNEHGYGVFWNGERLEKAHRFAYRAAGHVLWTCEDLRHHCDTPSCVEPAHLVPGSTQENVNDMWRRRRAVVLHRRGTAQTQAKLTDEKATAIRARRGENQRKLAAEFGVSQRLVWNILHGKNWTRPSGIKVERGRGRD
jgi:hypothetical protein